MSKSYLMSDNHRGYRFFLQTLSVCHCHRNGNFVRKKRSLCYVTHQIATVTSYASATGTSKNQTCHQEQFGLLITWSAHIGHGISRDQLVIRSNIADKCTGTPPSRPFTRSSHRNKHPLRCLHQQLPSHSLSTLRPITFPHTFLLSITKTDDISFPLHCQ